jgi:hypothetical protein
MRGKVGDGTLMAGTRSVGRDCTPGRGAEICTAAVAVAWVVVVLALNCTAGCTPQKVLGGVRTMAPSRRRKRESGKQPPRFVAFQGCRRWLL